MISFAACFIQAFVFVFLGAAGFLLIAVMSLDQYLAICKPLHYATVMNLRTCCLLVTACFALGLTLMAGLVVKVSQLSFCGPIIPHFFCDLGPWSISPALTPGLLVFVLALCVLLASLIIAITAYSHIVVTVIGLPSAKETESFLHLLLSPRCPLSDVWQLCLYIQETKAGEQAGLQQGGCPCEHEVTPLLNPVIYTLWNKQVHQALRETRSGMKISRFKKKSPSLGVEAF